MELLQNLLDNSSTPVLTAFVLGLITALSPCPLATNIATIGYIGRQIDNQRTLFLRGILYMVGRIMAYTLLALLLIWLIGKGTSTFGIQRAINHYGELLIGPCLILIGAFMLVADKISLPTFSQFSGSDRLITHGNLGALALGIIFALTFCPTSAMFYFGMLIPMASASSAGWLLAIIYAAGTAIPVVIVAWALAFSTQSIGRIYGHMQTIQKYLNLIVALLFIGIGIYYCITIYF